MKKFSFNSKLKNVLKKTYSTGKFGSFDYSGELIFYVNGKKRVINQNQVDPTTTLIDYLRGDMGLTGTKLACGEGG